jgi:biotin carboxyl carrier protein
MQSKKNKRQLRFEIKNEWHDVIIEYQDDNQAIVTVDNKPVEIRWENVKPIDENPPVIQNATASKQPQVTSSQPTNTPLAILQTSKMITAPMPGKIIGISVKPLDQVSIGDEICILEAMKMQQTISTTVSGTVKNVLVQPGDTVTARQTIVEFE